MDDQLDNDLSRRIKEVFDNYDDASANEGWLKLREKFPEERRRRGLIWLWPAAAVLLLFLGIGLVRLFNAQQNNTDHTARIKPVTKTPSSPNTHNDSIVAHNETSVQPVQPQTSANNDTSGIAGSKKAIVASNPAIQKIQARAGASRNNAVAQNAASNPIVVQNNPVANPQQGLAQNRTNPSTNTGLPRVVTTNQQSPLLAHVDTSKKKNINWNSSTTPQLAVTTKPNAVAKPDTPISKPVVAAKKPSNIDEMFAADQGKTPDDSQIKADRRVKFGVFAATYVSYAKNGNNQVNGGGGFTAAIPIAKNLKFVTGASVNQNSFSYNYSATNSPVMFAAAYPATNVNIPRNNYNFSAVSLSSYERNASLLGIDVPLNLQYQFNTKKNPVYVLGGISSGTFINESYGYVYSNGSTQQVQTNKSLNDFYFARTLNFGFGVGYPVGKSQIVIEPFLKYPLEGMGAQQLKFGASGINLKFNFPTKK